MSEVDELKNNAQNYGQIVADEFDGNFYKVTRTYDDEALKEMGNIQAVEHIGDAIAFGVIYQNNELKNLNFYKKALADGEITEQLKKRVEEHLKNEKAYLATTPNPTLKSAESRSVL